MIVLVCDEVMFEPPAIVPVSHEPSELVIKEIVLAEEAKVTSITLQVDGAIEVSIVNRDTMITKVCTCDCEQRYNYHRGI